MTSRRPHDTDTLTPFDPTQVDDRPDAETVVQHRHDPDAQTHRLDPRAYAPLRVCPQCSLAWEITGQWCPSCGTAFDKSARESVSATRVMPARSVSSARVGNQPPLTRSARKRGETPPPPARKAPKQSSNGSAGTIILTVVAFAAAIAVAFFAGQSTRSSDGEVDQSISQAVNTAKTSAAQSYQAAFDKIQAEAADAVKKARSQALAEGEAKAEQAAQAQTDQGQSIFDNVTNCVVHGKC